MLAHCEKNLLVSFGTEKINKLLDVLHACQGLKSFDVTSPNNCQLNISPPCTQRSYCSDGVSHTLSLYYATDIDETKGPISPRSLLRLKVSR